MSTVRDVAITTLAIAVGSLIKVVWNLAGRVSRIEGRLNGSDRTPKA